MSHFPSDDEYSLSLPTASAVIRNNLGILAVAILASKTDLSQVSDYDSLIGDFHNIVSKLNEAYLHKYY